MSYMFEVRSAQAPPPLPIQALACTRLALLRRPTPSRLPARMRPAPYARLMTWQEASAFNQPLSFDTSSVTDMNGMFQVRSAPAPPPLPIQALACTLPPQALAPPCLHAARFQCPPFDSSGRKRLVRRKQVAHALRLVGEHVLHRCIRFALVGLGRMRASVAAFAAALAAAALAAAGRRLVCGGDCGHVLHCCVW